ncbi:DAHL domain-containing protein [Rhizobium johnstonii]|jgi:signal transduction histidine kinase|uniref:DAHL domain-containing protein n=1 Tax=Rhizobium johnstonii TaxID=3019933 RepID=UPI00140F533B|nr:hypothetical protein HA462_02915 [Rhizobium leguminosarum bv. trifolii]
MAARSNPPTDFILIFVFFVGSIIATIIAAAHGRDNRTHQSVLMTFRQLHVDQASLQRDVLQIRAGLLTNYDTLVSSVVALHRDLDDLRRLVEKSNMFEDVAMNQQIELLRGNIQSEEESVEEFKTRNALLHNSYRIFGHLLSADPELAVGYRRPFTDRFGDLARLMLQFVDEPNSELAVSLRLRLFALMRAPDELSHSLSRHGQMVLISRPMVDAALTGVQRSLVPDIIRQFEQSYLDAYMQANRYSNAAKLALAAIALSLCGLVAGLLARLRKRSKLLSSQLEFETVASRIKARLASSEPHEFSRAICAALSGFAGHFGADDFALSIVDIRSANEEELFEGMRGASLRGDRLTARIIMHLPFVRSKEGAQSYLLLAEETEPIRKFAIGCTLDGAAERPRVAVLLLAFENSEQEITEQLAPQMQSIMGIITDAIRLNEARKDRLALESRLVHSRRLEAVGTLAGGVAHEFNNCLGAVIGYGEMLRQSLRRRSKAFKYAEEIMATCHRALFITSEILSFSRKRETGTLPFDFQQAVTESIAEFSVTLPSGSSIEFNTVDTLLAVRGHPLDVQQILTNLCKNAFEASSSVKICTVVLDKFEPTTRISLSHGELSPGSYARLSVADEGPGIPHHLFDHIFEPFFTTKSHRGGTGLGLAAVHGSVVALSGQINVHAVRDHGTRFDIYVPLVAETPVPLTEFFPDSVVPRGCGELLLILDADEQRRTDCEDRIAAFGYEPIGFSTIDEVLAWIDVAGSPDLLIISLDESEMEECSLLKSNLRTTPLLFIGDRQRDYGGRNDVFLRPFDNQLLSELLRAKILEGQKSPTTTP